MGKDMSDFSLERSTLLLEGMLDIEWIQKQQEIFCSATNLYAFCVDRSGKTITSISGEKEQANQIYRIIIEEHFQELYDRISGDELEEQIIEHTKFSNVKLAVIAITDGTKRKNNRLFYVFVAGIFAAKSFEENGQPVWIGTQTTTEEQFINAIDLLRNMYQKIYETSFSLVSAQAEIRRSRFSQKEAEQSLARIEVMTEIVQLLESDESIEVILEKLLCICGEYLQISSAQIFRLRADGQFVGVLKQWNKQGTSPLFDQEKDIPKKSLLLSDKLLVIGMDSAASQEDKEVLSRLSQKAVVTIPITINGTVSMYAAFHEQEKERNFRTEEVKFMHDAVKIMQSIIVKRIQKNSLASSYASLEAILDHVGSAIFVTDAKSHEVLFVNQTMKNNFEKEMQDGTLEELLLYQIPEEMRQGKTELFYEMQKTWYDLYFTDINWVDGRNVTLYAIYDITDKKTYQNKIEQQAYTDFLTGLNNRLCCERDLQFHIDKAKEAHAEGTLLYLDLDDFKQINDGLGHQYGDTLLKLIAHDLQNIEEIRDTCYRMGGDEFIIIISSENDDKVDYIMGKIKEISNKRWLLKDTEYDCTMSMGSVRFPGEGCLVQDLIRKADTAMYEAKKSGKNRVVNYSSGSISNKKEVSTNL